MKNLKQFLLLIGSASFASVFIWLGWVILSPTSLKGQTPPAVATASELERANAAVNPFLRFETADGWTGRWVRFKWKATGGDRWHFAESSITGPGGNLIINHRADPWLALPLNKELHTVLRGSRGAADSWDCLFS